MLPSRGLTRAHGLLAKSQILPRASVRSIPRQTTPNFTSTSRASIASTRQFGTNLRSSGRCSSRGSPVGFLSGSRIGAAGILSSHTILSSTRRFASTDSTDSTDSASAEASTPSSEFSSDFSSWTDLDSSSLLDLTEKVGFLSNLGLDYGIGPTSILKYVLEHLHFTAGLPWWASVVGLATVVRVVLFYPTLRGQQVSGRSQEMRKDPVYVQTQQQLMALVLGGNAKPEQIMELRMQQKLLQERAGVSNWQMFLPMMLQFPIIIGAIRLTRSMAALPVPGLENSGTLWFTDLTMPDPLYVLPLVSMVLMYFTFQRSMPYMPEAQAKIMRVLPWVLGPIGTLVTMKWAAIVQLYLAAAAILQYAQTALWFQPTIRRWVGLPPLVPVDPGLSQPRVSPFSNVRGSNNSSGGVQYQAPRTINTTASEAGTQKPVAPSEQDGVNPFAYFKNMANNVQAGLKDAKGSVTGTIGDYTQSNSSKKKQAQHADYQKRMGKQADTQFWNKAQEQRRQRGAAKK